MLDQIEPLSIIQAELRAVLAALIGLLPNLAAGLLMLLVTWAIVFAGTRLTDLVVTRAHARPSLRRALKSLVRIFIWTVGLLITATIIVPDLTPTKLLAGLGLGSIAVGLAFKDIFENYIAGMLILLRKPMRIGDDIECEAVSGRVEEITIRDTYLRKRSGELVLIPNSYIYKNPTIVLTDKPKRRISVVVGVAYGEDVDEARKVIRAAFDGLEGIDAERGIEVFAREFNSSSIDFLVRWWSGSSPIEEHRARDLVVAAIKRALDEAGIEIPFPYRTLTFKEPLRVATEPDDTAEKDGREGGTD